MPDRKTVEPVNINLKLEDGDAEDFTKVKNHMGLKNNSEVFRALVKNYANRL